MIVILIIFSHPNVHPGDPALQCDTVKVLLCKSTVQPRKKPIWIVPSVLVTPEKAFKMAGRIMLVGARVFCRPVASSFLHSPPPPTPQYLLSVLLP